MTQMGVFMRYELPFHHLCPCHPYLSLSCHLQHGLRLLDGHLAGPWKIYVGQGGSVLSAAEGLCELVADTAMVMVCEGFIIHR